MNDKEARGAAGAELDRLKAFLQARFPGAYCHLSCPPGDGEVVDLAIELLCGTEGEDS